MAIWIINAYAVFLAIVFAWTLLANLPEPGSGHVQVSDPKNLPIHVTEKGKTYQGEQAREKLGEWLVQHGFTGSTSDESSRNDPGAAADRFVRGLTGGFAWLMMIIFLVVAVAFALLATYLGFFFLPFMLTLPLSLGLAVFWARPRRFLMLRPFKNKETNRPLRRIIARSLAGFGHTYTLADSRIHVPLYIRIPILVGQLSFFAFHRRKVRKPATSRSLPGPWAGDLCVTSTGASLRAASFRYPVTIRAGKSAFNGWLPKSTASFSTSVMSMAGRT